MNAPTAAELDVVGIGNAIVDVLAPAAEALIGELGLTKGAMTLIDAAQAQAIYEAMADGREMSGGSAANTMTGLASLGAKAGFIGKVRADPLGGVFAHDIRAARVEFDTQAAEAGAATARCLILVTPDAERTMATFLGASVELGPEDIDDAMIAGAKVTYLEGYLWDPPKAKAAFRRAVEIAHGAGREVALTLSDAFCVERHRDDFLELVADGVDILFANEAEIIALYRTDDFDAALKGVRGHCKIAALTRGDKGSVVVTGEAVHAVDAAPVAEVLDTTGAGDLYAAGFLYGYTQGLEPQASAIIGGIAAAEAIGHFGARPEVSLAGLIAERLG